MIFMRDYLSLADMREISRDSNLLAYSVLYDTRKIHGKGVKPKSKRLHRNSNSINKSRGCKGRHC